MLSGRGRWPHGRRAAAHPPHRLTAPYDLHNCRGLATALRLYKTAHDLEETGWRAPRRQFGPGGARSRSWPSGTCGCTSRGCRRYDDEHEVPIIVRGDGCYVWDEHGNRYLDALSALFCVNIGHGRADVAQAGADQAKELGFFTNWSYAHPPRDRAGRADRVARARATSTASSSPAAAARRSSPPEARAPVPQAHRQAEQDQDHRARDRLPRHQRSARCRRRASPSLRAAVRAAHAGRLPRPQHQHLPAAAGVHRELARRGDRRADRVRGPGHGRGRDPRAGPERGRLLHARPRATSSGSARSATSTTCC